MEPIVGIDFGTTNSAVGVMQGERAVICAQEESGERVIPSAVHIPRKGEVHVGRPARNVAVLHPESTVLSVKREMGRGLKHCIHGEEYTSEWIASCIMGRLKEMAGARVGREVSKAVVTVPAYYDDPRRQAVRRAAQGAGLEVVRLINEPTAACLAYGLGNRELGHVVVYDLGGGTFDVSVLRAGGGVFEVCASRGDNRLGGDDFDRRIAQLLAGRFAEENGVELEGDRFALQKVLEEAERVKRQLSSHRVAQAEVPFIAADERGPLHLRTRITRQEFEELITDYIERTLGLTRGVLKDAGLRPEEVDRLLLVGGSTRIPMVREGLEKLFGRPPEGDAAPEEVVALGAGVQGGVLSGELEEVVLVDVTPLGVGVQKEGEMMVTMVPRNTPLPCRVKAEFTTVVDYQKAATIHVLQGERPRAGDNISLGCFRLEGIRSACRGEPRIEVCFEIDVDGIVHVSGRDMDTGNGCGVDLDNPFGLSEEEVEGVLAEARVSEMEDLQWGGKPLRAGVEF